MDIKSQIKKQLEKRNILDDNITVALNNLPDKIKKLIKTAGVEIDNNIVINDDNLKVILNIFKVLKKGDDAIKLVGGILIAVSILLFFSAISFIYPHKVIGEDENEDGEFTFKHEYNNNRDSRIISAIIELVLSVFILITAILIILGFKDSNFKNKAIKYILGVFFVINVLLILAHLLTKRGVFHPKKEINPPMVYNCSDLDDGSILKKTYTKEENNMCKVEGESIIYNTCVGNKINELYDKCIVSLKNSEEKKFKINIVKYNNVLTALNDGNNLENELSIEGLQKDIYFLYKKLDINTKCNIDFKTIGIKCNNSVEIDRILKAYNDIKQAYIRKIDSQNVEEFASEKVDILADKVKPSTAYLQSELEKNNLSKNIYMYLRSFEDKGCDISNLSNLSNFCTSKLTSERVVNYKIQNNKKHNYCLIKAINDYKTLTGDGVKGNKTLTGDGVIDTFNYKEHYDNCVRLSKERTKYDENNQFREVKTHEENSYSSKRKVYDSKEDSYNLETVHYNGNTYDNCVDKHKFMSKRDCKLVKEIKSELNKPLEQDE